MTSNILDRIDSILDRIDSIGSVILNVLFGLSIAVLIFWFIVGVFNALVTVATWVLYKPLVFLFGEAAAYIIFNFLLIGIPLATVILRNINTRING